ncbi:MAG: hypothetical protein AAGC60_22935 [Acidobacteriota bacterium]
MKKLTLLALALTALLLAGALYALTSTDTATGPAGALQAPADTGAFTECPRDILCLDVWDPVICDDGRIYSNFCYAYRACATGCTPFLDGPMY